MSLLFPPPHFSPLIVSIRLEKTRKEMRAGEKFPFLFSAKRQKGYFVTSRLPQSSMTYFPDRPERARKKKSTSHHEDSASLPLTELRTRVVLTGLPPGARLMETVQPSGDTTRWPAKNAWTDTNSAEMRCKLSPHLPDSVCSPHLNAFTECLDTQIQTLVTKDSPAYTHPCSSRRCP